MSDDVLRKPIQAEVPTLDVVVTDVGLDIRDLLPKKQFHFKGVVIADDAVELKHMFQQFIEQNLELISPSFSKETDMTGYVHGFRDSVALFNLWVDSMYIKAEN